MVDAQITASSSAGRWTAMICGILLACFAVTSYSAVLTKNGTIDEPSHILSGWLSLRLGDFRLETVNPSLWKMYAALADAGVNLKLPPEPAIWKDVSWNLPPVEVGWTSKTLYDTPGVDGGAFVNRARAMMLVLGVLLGALIARWAYRLAGPVAAIVAAAVYSFDPNFIAQAPMAKSDIAFSLDLLGLAYVTWKLGQRATWRRVIGVGLICGVAGGTKYSGFIVGPILALMLASRALMPLAWDFLGRNLQNRLSRLSAAVAVSLFAAVCCYVITWASYGFHFGPTRSPNIRMDMEAVYARARLSETSVDIPHPTPAQMESHKPSLTIQFVKWADRAHFLPEPMLAGLLYQHSCVLLWPAFLHGEHYGNGRWYYFPLAMLYKTPVSELAMYALAAIMLVFALTTEPGHVAPAESNRDETPRPGARRNSRLWILLCFIIPSGIFGGAALTTHLNIGFRNVLPFFSFVQIAIGCAGARCWRKRPRATAVITAILWIGLTIETLSAWPDYIAFFNFPCGGEIGGLAYLGDNNLGWGQDLIGLARWQREHPDVTIFAKLEYSVDPAFYGLKYHEIIIDPAGNVESDIPLQSGVIAVSATQLQDLYVKPWEEDFYKRLRKSQPIAIIGGTVYIYPFHQ